MLGTSYKDLTPDEIEVRVWAFVVKSITVLVLGIAFGVLYAIAFEEQSSTLAPIDAVFLETTVLFLLKYLWRLVEYEISFSCHGLVF